MNEAKRKLTLYPATYQIKVPGRLEAHWVEWADNLSIEVDCQDLEPAVTTLYGTMDQAALQGILRRLYRLGLPLISVIWIAEE